MKLEKYTFTTKTTHNQMYLYLQKSAYINKRVITKSYSVGKISNINQIIVKLLNTSESLFIGELIFFQLYEKIGLNKIVSKDLMSLGADKYQIKIVQSLMPTRILRPFSKLKLSRYLHHSLMKFFYSINHVNDIYDAMELIKDQEIYFRKYVKFLAKKLNYDHKTSYFDTTNIYLYSTKDDFKTFARSKDGKRGLPHFLVALACTEDRIPLYYSIDPGKTADITSFKKFIKTNPDTTKILIFDAGCYSSDLITQLESEKLKYNYICSADISKYAYISDSKEITLHSQKWKIREATYNTHRVIEAYNVEHHKQKTSKIEENVSKIKEFAQNVTGKTIESKRDKVYDLISSLGLKSQIKVEIIENELKLSINNEKIKKLKNKAKKIVMITSLDYEPSYILERYLGRIEVEKAFQYLKNPLSIRPVFHEKEVNIRAHGFIVMMGYLQLAFFRYYLLKTYNVDLTIDEILEELQFATCVVIEPKKDIFVTYMGKQVEWIKKLIYDLELPIITETFQQSLKSLKKV